MQDKVKAVVSIDADDATGVYANSYKIRARGEEAKIDFMYLDEETLDPKTREIQGTIVARVNMTGALLRELVQVASEVCAREYGEVDGE